MAIYYVNGQEINIPIHQQPFGQGSEGNLYLVKNKLYKIYHLCALNEGFGNKKTYHQSLLEVQGMFEKFILPESLIFDKEGNYAGYVTKRIGNKKQTRVGITNGSWDKFIENLKDFETEINLLSEHRFLAIDIGFHNSIFLPEDGNLYMIDPGRYHHQSFFTVADYVKKNRLILEDYFLHMLKREIIYFKLVPDRKITVLIQMLKEEKKDRSYGEYFEEVAEKSESIHAFIKKKSRYLH